MIWKNPYEKKDDHINTMFDFLKTQQKHQDQLMSMLQGCLRTQNTNVQYNINNNQINNEK